MEIGKISLTKEQFSKYEDIVKRDVKLISSKNVFNKDDPGIVLGSYVDFTSGLTAINASYNATGFIPVTAGLSYALSYKHQVAWYNAGKVYISGSNSTDTNKIQVAPVNAAFLRCSMLISSTPLTAFQVEQNTATTAYSAFGTALTDGFGSNVTVAGSAVLASDTDVLSVAPTHYMAYNYEWQIQKEIILKDFDIYKRRIAATLTGGKELSRSLKYVPVVGDVNTTKVATIGIYDNTYQTSTSINVNLKVSDPTKNTAINIQNIGDSYTGRMSWINIIAASAGSSNITWSGNRQSNASVPTISCEGQGGWTLENYFTVDYNGYLSPFMQPVAAGYKYYGLTTFWIDANSVTPTYNAGQFTTLKTQFNAITGYKIAPVLNDVMGTSAGVYVVWNGTAWVSITSATLGGFAFSYGKYRATWSIPAPTFVHTLLGTNDFATVTDATFAARFATYKTYYDTMIASIKADTPTVKILIGIPVSSGKAGEYGTPASEIKKRGYYLLAKNLISSYAGQEASNIYLIDYHSQVDRVYGFGNTFEPPMLSYIGYQFNNDVNKTDSVHLSQDGFNQMGNAYMGIIQWLR